MHFIDMSFPQSRDQICLCVNIFSSSTEATVTRWWPDWRLHWLNRSQWLVNRGRPGTDQVKVQLRAQVRVHCLLSLSYCCSISTRA